MLFSITLLACVITMAQLFRRSCLHAGRVHINPIFGLLLGVLFYVLVPTAVIYYFSDLIDQWTVYGQDLSQGNAVLVLLFTLALLFALNLGASAWHASRPKQTQQLLHGGPTALQRRWTGGTTWPASLAMALSMLLFLVLAFSVRGSLFAGYDPDVLGNDSVWAARGAMSSAYSIFYVALCIYILKRRQRMKRAAQLLLALSFSFSSVILLSMGARLYVAMALISLLALKSAISDGIAVRKLAVFLLAGALLMGSVGVLRSGTLEGAESVLRNVTLEPLLTSISLYTLLANNPPIWIGKVHMFLADFQAVLPSVLFPNKAGLFDRLESYSYLFEAPVGGYHLYFSGLINFGYIGFWFVAVWAGYVLTNVSRRPISNPIHISTLTTGIYLSGALAFTVFRDPFFIAIAKNVLIMAILLPIVLTGFSARARRSIQNSHTATVE